MQEAPAGYACSTLINDVEEERMDRDIDLLVQAFWAKCREVIRPEIDSAIKAELDDWLATSAP
jgi:hypothetical protein